MSIFNLIRSDYRKYRKKGGHFLSIVFFNQRFLAVFCYRFAHAVYSKITVQPFRFFFLVTVGVQAVVVSQYGSNGYIS